MDHHFSCLWRQWTLGDIIKGWQLIEVDGDNWPTRSVYLYPVAINPSYIRVCLSQPFITKDQRQPWKCQTHMHTQTDSEWWFCSDQMHKLRALQFFPHLFTASWSTSSVQSTLLFSPVIYYLNSVNNWVFSPVSYYFNSVYTFVYSSYLLITISNQSTFLISPMIYYLNSVYTLV